MAIGEKKDELRAISILSSKFKFGEKNTSLPYLLIFEESLNFPQIRGEELRSPNTKSINLQLFQINFYTIALEHSNMGKLWREDLSASPFSLKFEENIGRGLELL